MSDSSNSSDSGALKLFNMTDDSSSASGKSPPLLVNADADAEWPTPKDGADVLWEVDGKPFIWYLRKKNICTTLSDWEDEDIQLPSKNVSGGPSDLQRKSSRKKKNHGEKEKIKRLTQASSGRPHRRNAAGGATASASTSASARFRTGNSEVKTVPVAQPPPPPPFDGWEQEEWEMGAQLEALPSVVASRKRKTSSSMSVDGCSEEEDQEMESRVKAKRSCSRVFKLDRGGNIMQRWSVPTSRAPNSAIRYMSLSSNGNSAENEIPPGSNSNTSMIVSLEEITRLLDTQLDLNLNSEDDGFSEM